MLQAQEPETAAKGHRHAAIKNPCRWYITVMWHPSNLVHCTTKRKYGAGLKILKFVETVRKYEDATSGKLSCWAFSQINSEYLSRHLHYVNHFPWLTTLEKFFEDDISWFAERTYTSRKKAVCRRLRRNEREANVMENWHDGEFEMTAEPFDSNAARVRRCTLNGYV